ncbi:hypothetical protein AGMMS49546_30070 [Spirochaetia bacterium]|nr:hypothetical protein AGMMS49546_30070 [Spirochaetia bacterium]
MDKLISHGEGWLEKHPDKKFITRRYFNKLARYTRLALDRIDNGEGMVVKPFDFIARGKSAGLAGAFIQPAVKCRGREYLRIIYGPEYTESARLERLRRRSLGKKRHLAMDEFSLGITILF